MRDALRLQVRQQLLEQQLLAVLVRALAQLRRRRDDLHRQRVQRRARLLAHRRLEARRQVLRVLPHTARQSRFLRCYHRKQGDFRHRLALLLVCIVGLAQHGLVQHGADLGVVGVAVLVDQLEQLVVDLVHRLAQRVEALVVPLAQLHLVLQLLRDRLLDLLDRLRHRRQVHRVQP